MLKKVINYREVNLLIQEKLRKGISRSQILSQLSEIYVEKKTLAKLIATNVSPEKKAIFKSLNNLLLALLFISLVLKALFSLSILAPNPFGYVAFIVLFLHAFLIVSISKYNGSAYGLLVILGAFTFIGLVRGIESMGDWALFDLGIILTLIFLAYYLKTKMFPQLGWLMPKTGEGGKIFLGE